MGFAAAAGSWEGAPARSPAAAAEPVRAGITAPPPLPAASSPRPASFRRRLLPSPAAPLGATDRSDSPSSRGGGGEKLARGPGQVASRPGEPRREAAEEVGPAGQGCDCCCSKGRKWLLPALPMGVWSWDSAGSEAHHFLPAQTQASPQAPPAGRKETHASSRRCSRRDGTAAASATQTHTRTTHAQTRRAPVWSCSVCFLVVLAAPDFYLRAQVP